MVRLPEQGKDAAQFLVSPRRRVRQARFVDKTPVILTVYLFGNITVGMPVPAALHETVIPADSRTMKQVTSMMAGIVVEILVKQGDQVSDGQEVAILESMKMQLPVQSTAGGKVKEIKAGTGDFVNEGDTLLVLE